MTAAIDVVIPTLRNQADVQAQICEIERTAGVPVRVLATCTVGSASANRNIGLNWARSPVIVMVDDDVERFPEGWVAAMVAVLEQYPDCVMASARLMKPDGSYGVMMGGPGQETGCEILPGRELCTACIVIRNTGIRFDERFQGSGFEDNDYCRQLVQRFPAAQFICNNDVRVVHRNEMKNQHGKFWPRNRDYYRRKWGLA